MQYKCSSKGFGYASPLTTTTTTTTVLPCVGLRDFISNSRVSTSPPLRLTDIFLGRVRCLARWCGHAAPPLGLAGILRAKINPATQPRIPDETEGAPAGPHSAHGRNKGEVGGKQQTTALAHGPGSQATVLPPAASLAPHASAAQQRRRCPTNARPAQHSHPSPRRGTELGHPVASQGLRDPQVLPGFYVLRRSGRDAVSTDSHSQRPQEDGPDPTGPGPRQLHHSSLEFHLLSFSHLKLPCQHAPTSSARDIADFRYSAQEGEKGGGQCRTTRTAFVCRRLHYENKFSSRKP